MFGGLTALLASEVGGVVRRNVTVYGLLLVAVVIAACAIGYGLDALHGFLALRYGAIAASLWVAGGLLLLSLILLSVALYLKNRRRPGRPLAAAALVATPVAAKLIGARVGWRLGLLGAIVVLGVTLGRQFVKSSDDDEA